MGDPSLEQLKQFLRELYHPDNSDNCNRDTVFLGTPSSDVADFLRGKGKHPDAEHYKDRLFLIVGAATSENDVDRAAVAHAEQVVVLPSRAAEDGPAEDRSNLLALLRMRHYLLQEDAIRAGLQQSDTTVNRVYSQAGAFCSEIGGMFKPMRVCLDYVFCCACCGRHQGPDDRRRLGTGVQYDDDDEDDDGMADMAEEAFGSRQQHRPTIPRFVVMLRTISSLKFAQGCGVSPNNCVPIDSIDYSMLGCSVGVPGLPALLTNLIVSRADSITAMDRPWAMEYKSGAS